MRVLTDKDGHPTCLGCGRGVFTLSRFGHEPGCTEVPPAVERLKDLASRLREQGHHDTAIKIEEAATLVQNYGSAT